MIDRVPTMTAFARTRVALVLLLGLAALPAAAQDLRQRHYEPLFGTAGECVTPYSGTLLRIDDPAIDVPLDRAHLRVSYWGDPGTAEAAGAIGRAVGWDVGALTGVPSLGPAYQRGYYDSGLPTATSAVQANCAQVGVLLNTYWFSHTQPVRGGGPQASYGMKRAYPVPVYRRPGEDLVVQGHLRLPFVHWSEESAVGQIVFVYYMQPLRCPAQFPDAPVCPAATGANGVPAFAHVIALYDSRDAADPHAPTAEARGNDTYTAFFSSPLLDADRDGRPLRYLTRSPYSRTTGYRYQTWREWGFFRVHVSRAQMALMIDEARRNVAAMAALSPDPSDWGVVLAAALVETVPTAAPQCVAGTARPGCNDIVMGVGLTEVGVFASTPLAPAVD